VPLPRVRGQALGLGRDGRDGRDADPFAVVAVDLVVKQLEFEFEFQLELERQ
jgi:hypothetical protein